MKLEQKFKTNMISVQKPSGYWTKEKCRIEALKYKTKSEFKKNSVRAYDKSLQNGWLNEICSHMNSVKKLRKR